MGHKSNTRVIVREVQYNSSTRDSRKRINWEGNHKEDSKMGVNMGVYVRLCLHLGDTVML